MPEEEKNEVISEEKKKNEVKDNTAVVMFFIALVLGFLLGIGPGADFWKDFDRTSKTSYYNDGFEQGVRSVKVITFEQQVQNVEKEIKNKPEQMRGFLQQAVDIAVKSSPGAAIQVENYASQEMKKEMDQLRKSASVEALLRQKKDIEILKAQISVLERDNKKIPQLQQEATRLQGVDKYATDLRQYAEKLRESNEILQKENSRISKLEEDKSQLLLANNCIPGLRNQISDLQQENSRIPQLKAEIVELKKKSDSIPSLQQEIIRLRERTSALQREENRGNLGGGNPFVAAQKSMEAQKKAQQEKREKEEKEKHRGAEDSKPQGVPVLLVNKWAVDIAFFKITRKDTTSSPEVFYYYSGVISLLPGKYSVEIVRKGGIIGVSERVWNKTELTVTEKPLIHYEGKKWHGLLTTDK